MIKFFGKDWKVIDDALSAGVLALQSIPYAPTELPSVEVHIDDPEWQTWEGPTEVDFPPLMEQPQVEPFSVESQGGGGEWFALLACPDATLSGPRVYDVDGNQGTFLYLVEFKALCDSLNAQGAAITDILERLADDVTGRVADSTATADGIVVAVAEVSRAVKAWREGQKQWSKGWR